MKKLLGCFLCVMLLFFGVSSVGANIIDLTSTGSDIYNFQGGSDGSLWRVIQTDPTGTGVYEPFLRYQDGKTDEGPKDGIEIGLNTDLKPPPYEDKMPATKYTRSVLFDDLGVVALGGTNYWSFTIDFNEPGTDTRYLSFDTFDIWQGSVNDAGSIEALGSPDTTNQLFNSLDTVLTDYWLASSGSGADDIEFLIPVQAHTEDYMYLYIQSGAFDPVDWVGTNYEAEERDFTAQAGFEEIRSTGIPSVPEPATAFLLGIGLISLAAVGRRKIFKY